MSAPTKPVSVAMTEPLIKSLDKLSEISGLSRSAAIRVAVDEFLRAHGGGQ